MNWRANWPGCEAIPQPTERARIRCPSQASSLSSIWDAVKWASARSRPARAAVTREGRADQERGPEESNQPPLPPEDHATRSG